MIKWNKTMYMRLSNIASRNIISGKLSLALSWCLEVGEAEKHLGGCLHSSFRLSAEHEAHVFCALLLETRFEPMHQCSVEGFFTSMCVCPHGSSWDLTVNYEMVAYKTCHPWKEEGK